jgi:hypothetical protein
MVEPVRHRQTKGAVTDMFDLQPPRHTSTLPNLPVLERAREGPESLRVFGRLPVAGVRGCTEAGVRKASREETAGGVCAGSGVGLWGFSARV